MQDGMNITAIRDAIEKVFATVNEWGGSVGTKPRHATPSLTPSCAHWAGTPPTRRSAVPNGNTEAASSASTTRYSRATPPEDFYRGDAVPVIIIECKLLSSELWEENGHQLQAYVDAEPRMTEGLAVLTSGKRWIMYLLGNGRRLVDISPDVVDLINDDPDFVAGKLAQLMGWRNC